MGFNRQIILLLDTTNPYQRKIAQGIATYGHEKGNWDFHVVQDPLENLPYLEQDPLEHHPDLRDWPADGVIGAFHSRRTARSVCGLDVPMVGIEAECNRQPLSAKIPFFATNNEAIGRLGAEEFVHRGLKHLAFCGVPRTRFTTRSARRHEHRRSVPNAPRVRTPADAARRQSYLPWWRASAPRRAFRGPDTAS